MGNKYWYFQNYRYITMMVGTSIILLFIMFLINMKPNASEKLDRNRWAYPSAVIAVGRISAVKFDDIRSYLKLPKDHPEAIEEKKRSIDEINRVRREVAGPMHSMTLEMENCASKKRETIKDLQRGVLASFEVGTKIDVLGKPLEISLIDRQGQIDLTECIAQVMLQVQAIELFPRMLGTSLELNFHFEIRFLADEEAMGKGYLYQLAEDQWFKTLKSHRKNWQKCNKDQECTVVRYNCEIDAINIASIPAYEEAALLRRKPLCDENKAADQNKNKTIKATCRKQSCTISESKK